MGPHAVSLVFILSLTLTSILPSLTRVQAEDVSLPTTTVKTDNRCSPIQRRQDLPDTRINGVDSRLNTLQHEINTRLSRIDSRFDGMERMMSEMKEYLQQRLEAVEEKAELALTGVSPHLQKDQIMYMLPPKTSPRDFRPPKISRVHAGCEEALKDGWRTSGVYSISIDHDKIIDVYCEQRLDGGGWTVFQSRKDGSIDFYRNWNEYREGFGDLSGEFWLGNSNIHLLTKGGNQQLKIELISPDGEVKYADYSHFSIDDEARKYRLNVTGYSGGTPPGDSLVGHRRMKFSTWDQDNDRHSISCAEQGHGGWWYSNCNNANLNGLYGSKAYNRGLNWETWKGELFSLKATRMMLRNKP